MRKWIKLKMHHPRQEEMFVEASQGGRWGQTFCSEAMVACSSLQPCAGEEKAQLGWCLLSSQ